MKKYLFFVICFCSTLICCAQDANTGTEKFIIENDQTVISNEMIFHYPSWFKKNKKPLFMINGREVESIAGYYDHDDFKKITVLQPKQGFAKFGNKGKNGVIQLELNDDVKEPYIEIPTNSIYYQCEVNGNKIDTTLEYFNKVNGKGCAVLDLRETSSEHLLYIGFDNQINMKHLGVGWDMIAITISGATVTGTGANRIIRVQKEGPVRFMINAGGKQKEFILKAVALPAPKLN